jgi:hypothetical protein
MTKERAAWMLHAGFLAAAALVGIFAYNVWHPAAPVDIAGVQHRHDGCWIQKGTIGANGGGAGGDAIVCGTGCAIGGGQAVGFCVQERGGNPAPWTPSARR